MIFLEQFSAKTNKLIEVNENWSLIIILRDYYGSFFSIFFVSLLRNCNSSLCTKHTDKINVLLQHPAPSILSNLSMTKIE